MVDWEPFGRRRVRARRRFGPIHPTGPVHLERPDWLTDPRALCGARLDVPGSVAVVLAPRAGPPVPGLTFCRSCVRSLVCPECGERVEPGAPRLGGWALGLPPVRLAWRHLDGEPLCPVMGPGGYWPATPRVHPDRMAD